MAPTCVSTSQSTTVGAVVRAAARKLTPEARRDPAKREVRHRFYRQMLDYHREAQAIVSYWRL